MSLNLAPRLLVHGPQTGAALPKLLVLIVALALFVAPFLRAKDGTDWGAQDPTRRVSYPDDQEEGPYDIPYDEDLASFDEYAAEEELELERTLEEHVAEAVAEYFAADSEQLRDSGMIELGRLESGEKAFIAYCAGCHGPEGDGAGPAATHLHPRPRNFRKGMFKFISSNAGARPRREDIFSTITRGLVGSAMPDFRLVAEEMRWNMVEYVRWLSIRGEFEQLMLDLAWEDEELPDPADTYEIVRDRWADRATKEAFPSVPETPFTQESVDRGREYYLADTGASCVACHGEGGVGDGPAADAFLDAWGYPIRPRDLTTGVFRSGGSPKQLWLLIANGIQGTPMPGALGVNTAEEIWDMVHFVQSLSMDELPEGN
ncbi:MAG: cytochrome c [Planctomycetota bacterium]